MLIVFYNSFKLITILTVQNKNFNKIMDYPPPQILIGLISFSVNLTKCPLTPDVEFSISVD